MLRELRIENVLLIERAELRLEEGFNVITGETGAGKTVLAHSLDLLMGGRARPQIVRPGASEAWVEGDRKSTRLNSSHGYISYAVFCLKKKKHSESRAPHTSSLTPT